VAAATVRFFSIREAVVYELVVACDFAVLISGDVGGGHCTLFDQDENRVHMIFLKSGLAPPRS